MRLAKSVPLIFMVAFGALPLEVPAPASAGAGDVLENTAWSSADTLVEVRFMKRGTAKFIAIPMDDWREGTYRVSDNSVTMAFDGGQRVSGTLRGNRMKIRITWASGTVDEDELIKNVTSDP